MDLKDHLEAEENCWYCFGVHPKHAERLFSKSEERATRLVNEVTTLLDMGKTVALGEIGLDFSSPNLAKLYFVDDFQEQK